MEFTSELLAFFFVIAMIAGFLDTLAGGGGLITVPALIISGVPPLAALATNKLQACIGTATATLFILKNKKISWQQVRNLMLMAFVGSVIGTIVVHFINIAVLNVAIPVVLLIIGLYFLLSPLLSKKNVTAKISHNLYRLIVVPIIGCYDGMFGPGTGSFFALAGVSLRGQALIESTAIAKTLNFSTNIASLIVFLIAGKIVWVVGLIMMCGQALGAWFGVRCLFKINTNLLRPIIVLMCFAMLARYGVQSGWW